jgi:hypothetical protein
MPLIRSAQEPYPIAAQGSAVQYLYSAGELGAAVGPVPNGGNVTSPVLITAGMKNIAVTVQSTQAGAINIQRYLDQAGTIPQGPVVTAALVANTVKTLNVNDGAPFASFTVQFTNTGASPAPLTSLGVMVQAT